MYAETIQEGETYTNLKKSIVINLIDFDLIDETEDYHTIYKILEVEKKFELTDDLEIHYIELKKFEKQMLKLGNPKELEGIELWLTFIKKTGEEGTEALLESLVERSETIKMAKEMLKKISADEMLRQKYYAREKAKLDELSRIKYAEMKGMERGMERGMEQGMERGLEQGTKQGKVEIARAAIKEGIEIKLISKLTGLTIEEIEKLRL